MKDFDLDVSLSNDCLTAEISDSQRFEGDASFYFYLLKDGVVVERDEAWTTTSVHKWNLSSSGLYSVQAHVKRDGVNRFKRSASHLYVSDQLDERYRAFKSAERMESVNENELELYRKKYPYVDFAVASNSALYKVDGSIDRLQELGFAVKEMAGVGASLIFPIELAERADENEPWFISGVMRAGKKYYHGSEDFKDTDKELLSVNQLGVYTAMTLLKRRNSIAITTDYFGVGKVYGYKDGIDDFVFANGYHLLLSVLKAFALPMSFNKDKVAAELPFLNIQVFHQNFCKDMDVSGTFVVPVDNDVVVQSGKVEYIPSSISSALREAPEYTEKGYAELLQKAKNEILENVGAVLRNDRFDNVLIDLSGGMDSRVVYAAATNFPEFRKKIRINSHYSAAEPEDLPVALSVNSMYGYKYDDLPRVKELPDSEDIWRDSWSYNLGLYYSYVPLVVKFKVPNTVRLAGFYGEVCARPYYSRSYLGSDYFDVENPRTFVNRYFDNFSSSSIMDGCKEIDLLKKAFSEELERIPGRTALEKFDNHYIFYRNGLHFSGALRTDYSCPEFGPIMSKSLFEAKRMTFNVFKGIKLQLDLIHVLNPVVSAHEYEGAQDNKDKDYLKKQGQLFSVDPIYDELSVSGSRSEEDWREAKSKITLESGVFNAQSSPSFNEQARDSAALAKKMRLDMLQFLVRNNVVCDKAAKSMFYFFETYSDDPSKASLVWNLANRVASLYFQSILLSNHN